MPLTLSAFPCHRGDRGRGFWLWSDRSRRLRRSFSDAPLAFVGLPVSVDCVFNKPIYQFELRFDLKDNLRSFCHFHVSLFVRGKFFRMALFIIIPIRCEVKGYQDNALVQRPLAWLDTFILWRMFSPPRFPFHKTKEKWWSHSKLCCDFALSASF